MSLFIFLGDDMGERGGIGFGRFNNLHRKGVFVVQLF